MNNRDMVPRKCTNLVFLILYWQCFYWALFCFFLPLFWKFLVSFLVLFLQNKPWDVHLIENEMHYIFFQQSYSRKKSKVYKGSFKVPWKSKSTWSSSPTSFQGFFLEGSKREVLILRIFCTDLSKTRWYSWGCATNTLDTSQLSTVYLITCLLHCDSKTHPSGASTLANLYINTFKCQGVSQAQVCRDHPSKNRYTFGTCKCLLLSFLRV